MRQDMQIILLGRPRRRGGICCKRKNKTAGAMLRHHPEDLPQRESMKARWHFHYRGKETRYAGSPDHRKQFNDHMAPLVRFLAKHVGLKWDDVYSEIKEAELTSRSMLGTHFIFHLWDLVKRNVHVVGQVLWRDHSLLRPGKFYIHPDTGTLCRVVAQCL